MRVGTMRALALLLLLAALPARAEWVRVASNERGFFSSASRGATYYIDPSTITRDGNFRKVWEIHDLGDKGTQGERSILASVEYDCAGKRMRTLKATGKSLRMAGGAIIPLRGITDDWLPLRPVSDHEVFFKLLDRVCAP
jgi:hypothetical protein